MEAPQAKKLLQTEDWDAEWRAFCGLPEIPSNSTAWDARAATFTVKDAPNAYVDAFLNLAGIEPGESVLDMGCGAGHLAVPLAKMGCRVVAADFSEGMLERLRLAIDERNLHGVEPKKLAWEDDWEAAGIEESSFDAVISSRSIATSSSLKEHIRKMSFAARRMCCATVSVGTTPRIDGRVYDVCGIEYTGPRTHQYLLNILMNEGYLPSCEYLASARECSFESMDQAREEYREMLERCFKEIARPFDPASEEVAACLEKIDAWLESLMVENDNPNPACPGKLKLKEPRVSTWAFIAWNPCKGKLLG